MAEYTRSRRMSASADQLFEFLGRVEAMPSYIPSMTKAEPGDAPGTVPVAAEVQGRTVEGTAYLSVDQEGRRITWSSEGDNDYHGWLLVRGDDDTAEAEVHTSPPSVWPMRA
jgi:hypothetical protein